MHNFKIKMFGLKSKICLNELKIKNLYFSPIYSIDFRSTWFGLYISKGSNYWLSRNFQLFLQREEGVTSGLYFKVP